jgi:hypothetical protein
MSVPAPRKGGPFRAHAHAFLTEPHLGCSHLLLVLTPSPSEYATSQTCRLQISKVFDLFHSEKLINTSLRIPWELPVVIFSLDTLGATPSQSLPLHSVLIDREKPVPTDPKVQVLGVEGVRIDDQELLLIGQQVHV